MAGQPLPPGHGYPVWLVAPSRPGVRRTEWLPRVRPA
ncbi:molybdopterin-dependent oxidoreductase [Geodermatophilus maliterrae]|uniref:Molybdopterin-dependent oxidoreductase n=1 Tax=Geodermatophilus maliterrae TaxID=3162531 RepID=A0ABV3XBR4_9ACTN